MSKRDDNMTKAFVIPAKFSRDSHPGQVPRGFAGKREQNKVERAFALPKAPKPTDLSRDTSPRLTPDSVVTGLGLDKAVTEDYRRFVAETAKSSRDETTYRQGVHAKMLDDKLEPELRRVLADRAMSYYRACSKSFLSIDDLNDLQKAEARGGRYYRRVPNGESKPRYYYDESKYHDRDDAHVSGNDAMVKRIAGLIARRTSDQGIGPDELADWNGKFNPATVRAALDRACASGMLIRKGDRYVLPEENTMQKASDNKPGESLGETPTSELTAVLAKLKGKSDDPGSAARIKAISAELSRRGGKSMGKSQSVCEVVLGEGMRHIEEHDERVKRIDEATEESIKGNGGFDPDADGEDEDPLDAWMSKAEAEAPPQGTPGTGKEGEGSRGGKVVGHTADGKPVYEHQALGQPAPKPEKAPKAAPKGKLKPDAKVAAQIKQEGTALGDPRNVPPKFSEFHALHATTTPDQHSALASQATLAGQHGLAAAHANMAVAKRTGSINHFTAVQGNLDMHHKAVGAQTQAQGQPVPGVAQGPAVPPAAGAPALTPIPGGGQATGQPGPLGGPKPMPPAAPMGAPAGAPAVPPAAPAPGGAPVPPQFRKAFSDAGAFDEYLEKAKYTKRTGSPGNYQYEYATPLPGKELVSHDPYRGRDVGAWKKIDEAASAAGQKGDHGEAARLYSESAKIAPTEHHEKGAKKLATHYRKQATAKYTDAGPGMKQLDQGGHTDVKAIKQYQAGKIPAKGSEGTGVVGSDGKTAHQALVDADAKWAANRSPPGKRARDESMEEAANRLLREKKTGVSELPPADDVDRASAARRIANSTKMGVKKSMAGDLDEWLAKGEGEGSRGGKIIGHTSSGKPVYEASHGHYTEKQKLPKYNGEVSALSAHGTDGGKLLRQRIPEFSKQDHADASKLHAEHRGTITAEHHKVFKDAIAKHGEPQGGGTSGGAEPHFPDATKDKLRELSQASNRAGSAAVAHHGATGKRTPYSQSEFAKKSMEEVMDLDGWLQKSGGLPEGEPGYSEGTEVSRDEDGGKVAGVGKPGGEPENTGNGSKADVGAVPSPESEKLSEDDAEVEGQMKPHEKPIERLSKAFHESRVIPQARNEFEARQIDAARVSQLRKGEDSAVWLPAGPIRTPEAEPLEKSHAFTVGRGDQGHALYQYSDGEDRYIEKNLQGPDADTFYPHGRPSVGATGSLQKSMSCQTCGLQKSAALTACPNCGDGAVVQNFGVVGGGILVKSERPGPVLRRVRGQPVVLPNGIVVVDE